MAHNDNKYSVNSKLAKHDAEILELRALIKSTLLVPGPSGKQGQTGASGSDGKNGIPGRNGSDGKDAVGVRGATGFQGPRGIQGSRGERGEQGPAGESITGPAGPAGPKGDAGDITVYGDAELQAAVASLRAQLIQQRAKFQAAIFQALADANGPHAKLWRLRLETLKRTAGL